MADDDPFRFMLALGGSDDLAFVHPGVMISIYAEPILVAVDFSERPLEGICECCFLLETENDRTS